MIGTTPPIYNCRAPCRAADHAIAGTRASPIVTPSRRLVASDPARMPRTGPSQAATFGEQVLAFYRMLRAPSLRGLGVDVMNPYREPEARRCTEAFYTKFFADSGRRVFLIGINPGRFGAAPRESPSPIR